MNIEWTEPSLSDLESIREYIGRDSEHYASRFVERILAAVENLASFPEMGRRVPEAEEDENIRELLFQNYRINVPRRSASNSGHGDHSCGKGSDSDGAKTMGHRLMPVFPYPG